MSQPGEPTVEYSASASIYSNHETHIEVFVEPSSPQASTSPIAISSTSRKHLEIVGMYESQSAPSDAGSHFQFLNPPITRRSRSQSVPLSLDAVRISKKIVDISDRFNEKQSVKMRTKLRTRTLSDDEGAERNVLPKRHSDIWEEFMNSDRKSNIGSPV